MGVTEQKGHRGLAEAHVLEAGQIKPYGGGVEEQVYRLAGVVERAVSEGREWQPRRLPFL